MAERFMAGDGFPGPVRRWQALFPPAQWLPAYQAQWLRCDLIAGVTLAAYAVPVSMAYATLAGLPPPLRPGDVDGILPLAGACFLLAYIEGVSTVRTLLMLVGRVSRPHVAFLGRIPGTRRFSDLARHPDNEVVPGIEGIRVFKAAQGIQHYDVNTQATRQECVRMSAVRWQRTMASKRSRIMQAFFEFVRNNPFLFLFVPVVWAVWIWRFAMVRMRSRWCRSALALLLVVALRPSMGSAQPASEPGRAPQGPVAQQTRSTLPETEIVRSPDVAPPPPPQTGLLETAFPTLREDMSKLPPFLRDTDLNVRFRTFYFNRQNDDDTASEAWALGGWARYASGWLLDTFAIGATFYTSQPLYAPDDHPGSLLLTSQQNAIGVFGEAWGALRYKDYALLKGGRQTVDEGYVNPQDNRMVPNTFETIMLSGQVGWVQYDVGYLWTIKPRDSNDFISMSRQAGAPSDDEGLILAALALRPIKDLLIYAGNYYAGAVFNTAFVKAEYTHAVNQDLKLQFGLQFTDQWAVGDERLGDFTTWNVGVGARLVWKGLTLGAATHFTGDEASIRSPWGTWPGYLALLVTDFDRANEKAFGVAVKYDFGGVLLPFQLPGLSVQILYAQGTDRIDPATRNGLPTTREGDLDIIYTLANVKGLSLRFRNGYVSRGNSDVVMDFRLIVNYELDLL